MHGWRHRVPGTDQGRTDGYHPLGGYVHVVNLVTAEQADSPLLRQVTAFYEVAFIQAGSLPGDNVAFLR